MTEVKINKLSLLALMRLSRGGKKRNKKLLEQLAEWNRDLKSPVEILALLELTGDDITFLDSLGKIFDGWHPYTTSNETVCGDQKHLAALGLILFNWRKRRISLADAGRFLLVLVCRP